MFNWEGGDKLTLGEFFESIVVLGSTGSGKPAPYLLIFSKKEYFLIRK